MSAFRDLIRYITDGEAVDAAVTNRPSGDLAGNINYLRDLIDSALLGQALYWRSVPAAAGVLVGEPVYWDETHGQLAQALAAVTIDGATNSVVGQPSTDVIGVCSAVYASGLIDVHLVGVGPLDITAAVGSAPQVGRYYLSTATPGGLVQQSPSISVPVLFSLGTVAGQPMVCVLPQIRNFLNDHAHFTIPLFCQPAGTTTPPSSGQPHVITADDATKPGWLNATDPIFNGMAPTGAAFGYNLSQHPELQAIWPPLPVGGAVLFWDKGLDTSGGTLVPMGVNGGLVIVDETTLWWASDCYGDVPWPITYNSASPPTPLGPDTTPPTCPRPLEMRLTLGYYVSLFASRSAIVTQLRSTPGSPITVTDQFGNPASAGALQVGINWSAMVGTNPVNGAEVLKTFTGGNFTQGFVAEGLQLAGAGLSALATRTYAGVTATATAIVTGGSVTGYTVVLPGYGYAAVPTVTVSGGGGSGATATAVIANGVVTGITPGSGGSGFTSPPTVTISAPRTIYQGIIQLQQASNSPTIEVTPDVVKLTDASERSFLIPPYLGFPSDRASSILLKYEVPPSGLSSSPIANVLLTFYGIGGGTIPTMTASYWRITGTSGSVPSSPVALTLTTGQSLTTGNFLQVSTSTFAVLPGDTIFVQIGRAGSDGYASELGLIRQGLILN